jgi:CRP/FNR family transcriptional regulator
MKTTDLIMPHGHLDVLGTIPSEYRQSILQQCARRKCKKNHVLWHQGDQAEYVGFLVQGKAMSTYASPNGKTGITGFWSSGDILGAADMGTTRTRQMTVRCLDDSHIFTLTTEKFFEVASRFPELSIAVIRALSIRLRWVAHLALTLETQNAFERTCVMLLALSDSFPQEHAEGVLIDLSLTNEFLAAMIGVTRQFANITLHNLERQELIRLHGRRIVICDRDRLATIAYQGLSENNAEPEQAAGG